MFICQCFIIAHVYLSMFHYCIWLFEHRIIVYGYLNIGLLYMLICHGFIIIYDYLSWFIHSVLFCEFASTRKNVAEELL